MVYSSSGLPLAKSQALTEVEDGEVDDAKLTARTTSATVTAPVADMPVPLESRRATPPAAALESKKSELLEKRELFKAQQAKNHESTPPRSVVLSRPIPNESRTPTSLPNRPDVHIPGRELLDRHPSRHGERRDGRDFRFPDPRTDRPRPGESRPGERPGDWPVDRPGDRIGERIRDFSGNDRRINDSALRDFGRPSERPQGPERERVRPDPPPRWTADSAREKIDRSVSVREADDGRLSRDMPLPRPSAVASSDRATQPMTDRLPSANPERQDIINPERAALISGDNELPRLPIPRRGRDEVMDRVSSRPQSPRRHGVDKERSDFRRDDRQLRGGPPEIYNSPRSRTDDYQPPPAGPRSDRPAEKEWIPNFQSTQPHPRSLDPDHGRLNLTSRSQPDPNFGRLVAPPASDIPSGPRDRSTRGGRMGNAPPPMRQDGRIREIPRPPTPEKQQPPTGPSSRHLRRSGSDQFDMSSPSAPAAAPTLVTNIPSTSAIHPDRLRHLGTSVIQTPPPLQPINLSPVGVHPDRLRAFGNEEPSLSQPLSQIHNPRSRPTVPPLATQGPPSGPKGSQTSPVIPVSNGFAAPTGPASATERAARGGRRQLAGINTMLQQGAQQSSSSGTTIRGRGGRLSGVGSETPVSGPSTPVLSAPPPLHGFFSRGEPSREFGRDPINPTRADLITGPDPLSKERDQDRSARRERSGRSHRSPRSPGRERDSKRDSEDGRQPRSEHRDRSERRIGEREPDKERHQNLASPALAMMVGRDPSGVRDSMGARKSGRDHERGDRDSQSSRRDGYRDLSGWDPNAAGWNGGGDRGSERGSSVRSSRDARSGEMRSDEHRRDSRGSREDGSRKRRSDEGGMDSRNHGDKRPRRG